MIVVLWARERGLVEISSGIKIWKSLVRVVLS